MFRNEERMKEMSFVSLRNVGALLVAVTLLHLLVVKNRSQRLFLL